MYSEALDAWRVHLNCRWERTVPIPGSTQEDGLSIIGSTQRWVGQVAKTNNSTIGCVLDIRMVEQFCLHTKGKWWVWLCLDQVRLNKELTRLVHRGPTLNDILPRLAGIKHLIPIDADLGYYNLELLSIWQVQIHTVAISGGTCWWYVPGKDRRAIPKITQCIWYCWWHSDCRVRWSRERPWCNIRQSIKNMQKDQPKGENKDKCLFRCISIPYVERSYSSMV